MKIVKQLAIFLENQPGALLGVTKDLASNGVNILAISVSDTVDHAVIRMVVDESTKAIHLLGEAGVLVVENDLLRIDLQNRPGILAELCQTLLELEMNIEYAYGSTGSSDIGMMYIRVMNPGKVLEVLQGKF